MDVVRVGWRGVGIGGKGLRLWCLNDLVFAAQEPLLIEAQAQGSEQLGNRRLTGLRGFCEGLATTRR